MSNGRVNAVRGVVSLVIQKVENLEESQERSQALQVLRTVLNCGADAVVLMNGDMTEWLKLPVMSRKILTSKTEQTKERLSKVLAKIEHKSHSFCNSVYDRVCEPNKTDLNLYSLTVIGESYKSVQRIETLQEADGLNDKIYDLGVCCFHFDGIRRGILGAPPPFTSEFKNKLLDIVRDLHQIMFADCFLSEKIMVDLKKVHYYLKKPRRHANDIANSFLALANHVRRLRPETVGHDMQTNSIIREMMHNIAFIDASRKKYQTINNCV